MEGVFMVPSNWPSTNPYNPDQPMVNKIGHYNLTPIEASPVEKPPHYNFGSIECIDYLKDNMTKEAFRGYLEGNNKKYMHRFRYKGKQLEDLRKAQWYLNYLIKEMEGDIF